MSPEIPNGENIYRSVIFPLSFGGKRTFQPHKFMALGSQPGKPHHIETSVIWERYAPFARFVHAFGCRLSAGQNSRRSNPKPGTERIYCGAYRLKVDDVRELARTAGLPEIQLADVRHVIEHGEIAHASLEIELVASTDEAVIEDVKTGIVDRLWRASSGPDAHICKEDSHLDPHPNGRLASAPSGPYSDDRTIWQRLWCLFRFLVVKLWHWLIGPFRRKCHHVPPP
jgi:hypothetical protein